MLYFDSIDVSEGTDVNKSRVSKECDVSHYWYFLNKGFKFQPNVCNRCHDLLMLSMNLIDIAILKIKTTDYRSVISGISKGETINIMQNIDFTGKIPKVDFNRTFLAVTSLGSALKKDENYYPKIFLNECKYIEKRVGRQVNDNFRDFSCSDESDEE